MRLAWIGVLSVAAIGVTPGWAAAGEGFYAGLSVGAGGATDTCSQCINVEREWGLAGDLRAGLSLGPSLRVGPEVGFWRKTEDGFGLTLVTVLGTATLHPYDRAGFFLKAGLGGAFARDSFDFGSGGVSHTETGLAFMAGAGYDLRVGDRLSLAPAVTYSRTNSIQFPFDDVPSLAQRRFAVLAFTVGVTLD